VLVFKDATGETTVKVADFGYSTLVAGEAFVGGEAPASGTASTAQPTSRTGKVFLPKSRPWNAPEHHYGEFSPAEAKLTDVYSFGVLCLWVLFGSVPAVQDSTEYKFDGSNWALSSLEQLKYDDKMEHLANQLMGSMPLKAEHRPRLKEFFSLTVVLDPAKRSSDFGTLLSLLIDQR
jgi:serine/threonine protein kinase